MIKERIAYRQTMKILVINSGSSSIKYKLFDMPGEDEAAKGLIEHIGETGSKICSHQMGLSMILEEINSVSAVGHRVVHGADKFQKPALINEEVIRDIRQCCGIAPLHNPANLSGILACKKLLPGCRKSQYLIPPSTIRFLHTPTSTGFLLNITRDLA